MLKPNGALHFMLVHDSEPLRPCEINRVIGPAQFTVEFSMCPARQPEPFMVNDTRWTGSPQRIDRGVHDVRDGRRAMRGLLPTAGRHGERGWI